MPKTTAINLVDQEIGYLPHEVQPVDPTDLDTWRKPLYLGGQVRDISAVPGHPGVYLRWISKWLGTNPETWESEQAKWLDDIITEAPAHFSILEQAGMYVPPQRHIALQNNGQGTATLFSVVPCFDGLTRLSVARSDHLPAVANCLGVLSTYTQAVSGEKQAPFLYDSYKLGQYSLTPDNTTILHDTEIRMHRPGANFTRHPAQAALEELATLIEDDLSYAKRVDEAALLQDALNHARQVAG